MDLFSSIADPAALAPPVQAAVRQPARALEDLHPARPATEGLHPARPAPGDLTPARPAPEDLMPVRPAPEDPTPARPAPEDLHPALWRAHQLGRPANAQQGVLASGHAELDAQLPGGGWPARVLTELLLPHAGVGELRLLAPALAELQRQQRSLMWFDPPAAPCAWALGALNIDVRQLVVVHSRGGQAGQKSVPRSAIQGRARALLPAADVLWALEQALKSGHLGAALAWLPARLPADALRRLQLAAQAHDGPVFLLRDAEQRSRPSAAPLRLLLGSAGPDRLRVVLLKRRGPPLAQALTLALAPVLSATALARAGPVRLPLAASSAAAAGPLRRALPL